MKSIALYVFASICVNIFVLSDEPADESCNYKTFLLKCCGNDLNGTHLDEANIKICRACIGRLCRSKCPQRYYGEHCNQSCPCDADQCDDVSGCLSTGLHNRKPVGMVLEISLSASIFIIMLLIVGILRVVYRKNNTSYPEVSTGRRNVEDITRDSPVIYAAVVRPNRKPVRSVEPNDLMYGKMPKPQKPNQGRDTNTKKCLDINISNNPAGEDLGIGSSTTYSFVRNPDRTLSQDLGQCNQKYGNMTTRI